MRKLLTLTAAAALVLALTFGFAGTAKADVLFPFDTDLVAYWPFDDATADDQAPSDSNDDDGTFQNGATTSGASLPPVASNSFALVLDGTDDFVSVPNSAELDFTGAYTISMWVNAVFDTAQHGMLIERGTVDFGELQVYLQQGGAKQLVVQHNIPFAGSDLGNFDFARFPTPPFATFFHLGVVFDGTDIKVFYDGVAQAINQWWGPTGLNSGAPSAMVAPTASGNGWTMGQVDHNAFGGQKFYDGLLDEVRIYDVALTEDEILQLVTGIAVEKELVDTRNIDSGGDTTLGIGENWEFTMLVTVTNNSSEDFSDVVIRDPLPGDLEIGDDTSGTSSACLKDEQPLAPTDDTNLDPSVGSVATKDKGRTDKCILDWTIGDFDSGDSETLDIIASTDENPGRGTHQEFTSSGPYCINQGAKFTGERDSDDAIIIVRSNGLLVPNNAVENGGVLDHDIVSHDVCDELGS